MKNELSKTCREVAATIRGSMEILNAMAMDLRPSGLFGAAMDALNAANVMLDVAASEQEGLLDHQKKK